MPRKKWHVEISFDKELADILTRKNVEDTVKAHLIPDDATNVVLKLTEVEE